VSFIIRVAVELRHRLIREKQMFNAFTNYIQYATENLSHQAILSTAIICTFTGLVIWLAGLSLARLTTAAIGGFVACFATYLFFTQNVELLALATVTGIALGLVAEVLLSHSLGYTTFGYNLSIAFITALSGSALVLTGMTLLLLFKGAEPLKHINMNHKFYTTVFAVMIVFGTFEQLILCKRKTSPIARRKHLSPAAETEGSQKSSWRNK
jgi:hypothetical protein